MSLEIRNTKEYLDPKAFRFKGMIYGGSGIGKTEWVGSCDPKTTGIAACETGLGNGLLTIADRGYDHIVPQSLSELETFCKGKVFPNKEVLVLDSISAMARTFIKDAALQIPRKGGDSDKRKLGVPELDDYGSIASLTARLLNQLFINNLDKHIIVIATEKWDRPNENDPPGTESLFGPDLAGQMFTVAPALFDFVLRLRLREAFRIPGDAKTRYLQRYFECERSRTVVAKCRANNGKGKQLLDSTEVFDLTTGEGSFPYLVEKIMRGYEGLK